MLVTMQIPKRKPGKYTGDITDPHITQEKFDELTRTFDRLKAVDQPRAIADVEELAKLGDFSENAAYQIAKSKLRGINQRLLEIEDQIHGAIIIEPLTDFEKVEVGHRVTVEISGEQKIFLILGGTQTDPAQGIISHSSPIGLALLGRRVGDTVTVTAGERSFPCTIISIE